MEFNYIIVGAGSAGCVLANRLSKNQKNRVLLIEAGPKNNSYKIKMPAFMLSNLKSTKYNWSFQSEPEPKLNQRILQHDRGKVLGGSSSINGMVYIRGHAFDYDDWQNMGCEGWSYADVLPYFIRMESYSGGDEKFRGTKGPLKVHRPHPEDPLNVAFLKAGAEANYPITNDVSGYRQEGFGVFDSTIHKGRRYSAADAYLNPILHRKNLTIITKSLVQKIIIKKNKTIGVTLKNHSNKKINAYASKDVILSAGAIGSPHLLMLSGIGPQGHLNEMGIDNVINLPGVGENLNDHPDFVLKYKCLKPVSLWPKIKTLPSILAGIKWFLTHKGMCASNHFDSVACIRSDPSKKYPDLQLCLSPIAVDKEWNPIQEHAFQIHLGLMRSHSRGSVKLKDNNPQSTPSILVNYLNDDRDLIAILKGINIVRDLVQQPAFSELCGDEIFPGKDNQSEKELTMCIKENMYSQWHLSGTASMGPKENPNSVVDKDGKVYGIDNLRVVDASIMPRVTNGNTNCPTIMLAEKMSDAILDAKPLPKMHQNIWEP